jgi:hypothetical protein
MGDNSPVNVVPVKRADTHPFRAIVLVISDISIVSVGITYPGTIDKEESMVKICRCGEDILGVID